MTFETDSYPKIALVTIGPCSSILSKMMGCLSRTRTGEFRSNDRFVFRNQKNIFLTLIYNSDLSHPLISDETEGPSEEAVLA